MSAMLQMRNQNYGNYILYSIPEMGYIDGMN
jgi:hypothetical protein